MKALIIDDETMPAKYLAGMLKRNFSEFKVIEIAIGAKEGQLRIDLEFYDVIFLDIEMPHLNGFELLEKTIVPDETSVIFTTAYKNYALEAFKAKAVDYLLKPVDELELHKAIRKIRNIEKPVAGSLKIYSDNEYHIVKFEDILRVEADGSYSKIVTQNKILLTSGNLKAIEKQLGVEQFYRCHKSHLINISRVSKLGRGKGSYVVLENEDTVPVSATNFQGLSDILGL